VKVWLVTTWDTPCGIAEYAAYLTTNVGAADREIEHVIISDLHPRAVLDRPGRPDLVILNFHAALHSQWQPPHLQALRDRSIPTLVIFHDTGVPNSDQCLSLYAVADAFVVHEPCEDLPEAHYWRQGVPEAQPAYRWQTDGLRRPRLGTCGFNFPWKNFDLLQQAADTAGWVLHIIGGTVFMPREAVVSRLSGCDATAFLYNNCNTGTSGAIRQGIAARKPVIASRFPFGRQFVDLQHDPLAKRVITWIEPSVDALVEALSQVRIAPIDAGLVALATQDSWASLGAKYAQLYRSLI
jgi:hypothetical protein